MFRNIKAWALKPWTEQPPFDRFEGEEENDQHRIERKRLSENHYNRAQGLAAWLFATLVASNGAAALALLSTDQNINKAPALLFTAGVILAIMAGRYSWLEAWDKSGIFYAESLRDHQIEREGRARLTFWRRRARRSHVFARAAMLMSLWAFIVACGWTAVELII